MLGRLQATPRIRQADLKKGLGHDVAADALKVLKGSAKWPDGTQRAGMKTPVVRLDGTEDKSPVVVWTGWPAEQPAA